MTRLTDEQITQKAQAVMYAQPSAPLLEHYRAAIIATLTEYAPHLLPRDPDEELAERLAAEWFNDDAIGPRHSDLALYVIKHLDKERGK
jgi:hypothetical protein